MDLPDILPEQLNYAASAENDTELFDLLIKKIPDFFAFFFFFALLFSRVRFRVSRHKISPQF